MLRELGGGGGHSWKMNRISLTLALGCAALGLALIALPAGAGARSHLPGEVVIGLGEGETRVLRVAPGSSVGGTISRLERDPRVRFAEPNWIARASVVPFDQGSSGTPGGWQADQWNLLGRPGGIRIGAAWDRAIAAGAAGGAGTTVAVVDSGIAYTSAPGGQVAPDFSPAQFVPGIDLVDDDSLPLDENGHGTHVAGTIAEQISLEGPSSSDDFLTGIAYGAELMPVRVLDAAGAGSATDVGQGILWAARNGAQIINVSLQFDSAVRSCEQVPTVCAAARKARRLGSLVVAAAGNALDGNGRPRALFPGAAPGVLAVGATTEHGCLAAYSHYRKRTDLLAPGGGVARGAASRSECAADLRPIFQLTYECFPGDCGSGLRRFGLRPDLGTSMSAAHTSGVAALVRATRVSGADPSPQRLAERLRCTARPGSPKRFYGPGALDALRATEPQRHCDRP